MRRDWSLLIWRLALLAVLLAAWQLGATLSASPWTSSPSLVALRIAEWASGDLWLHLSTTLAEMAMGLSIGVLAGVLAGLILGRMPLTALLLRPLIVALYSVTPRHACTFADPLVWARHGAEGVPGRGRELLPAVL